MRDIATRVLAQVKSAADEILVSTPVGGMRLIDYLPSRVFELAVHTLDLATALPVAVTLPATVAAVSLHLLAVSKACVPYTPPDWILKVCAV